MAAKQENRGAPPFDDVSAGLNHIAQLHPRDGAHDLEGKERRSQQRLTVDVCLANGWSHPTPGGAIERFRRYAPALRSRGVDLRAVIYTDGGIMRFHMADPGPAGSVGANNAPRREPICLFKLLKECWHAQDPPHVMQFFSRSYWNALFVRAIRFLGVSCLQVVTLSDQTPGSPLRRFLRSFYRRWLFEPFDKVVVSSEVIKQELLVTGISASRIEVIPNGVDLVRFRPVRSSQEQRALRRRLGIELDAEVIVFVGGILPRKGVDVLIASWSGIARSRPLATLLLVGARHEDDPKTRQFRNRLHRLVVKSTAPQRIVFTGMVTNVEEYLRAADVFVFPSLREGMGNAVLEAMATGLPCILTPFHGLPAEIGEAGREYMLVPRMPEDLANSIVSLLNNRHKRRVLGERARMWVERHLDIELSLDKFAHLYDSLARRNPPRRWHW